MTDPVIEQEAKDRTKKTKKRKGAYQRISAEGRCKIRSIRFTPTVYDQIRGLRNKLNWSFSKVVGEAVEWYLPLQPLLHEVVEKSTALSGKPLVLLALRDDLERYSAEMDEALKEIATAQAIEPFAEYLEDKV